MREILFRGKTKDTGKWVTGYYCKSPITAGNSEGDASDGWYFLSGQERHLIIQDGIAFTVNPETIDQYTGLNDKNGVKIFDRDVIFFEPFGTHNNDRVIHYKQGSFMGKLIRNGYSDWILSSEMYIVIGNVTDNPELLGLRQRPDTLPRERYVDHHQSSITDNPGLLEGKE